MRKTSLNSIVAAMIIMACAAPMRRQAEAPRPLAQASAKKLIKEAKSHLGEPYRLGGMSTDGWDCSGFVLTLYADCLNVALPHKSAKMFEEGFPLSVSRGRPGDLVFFKPKHGRPSHVGIYIGRGEFIHATKSGGVIISSLDEQYYSHLFMGIRRINYPNVAILR